MATLAEQIAADDAAVEALRAKFGDAAAAKLAADLYKLRRNPPHGQQTWATQQALIRVLTEGTDLTTLPVIERKKLADELRKGLPPESQRMTFRWIVWGLCAAAILPSAIVALALVIPWQTPNTNTQLISPVLQVSATAVGALAAYLTGRRSDSTST
jgi:hypothetical protein